MQLEKEIEVPASSILREDAGENALKVIKAAEEVHKMVLVEVGELLKITAKDQREETICAEEHTSGAAAEDSKCNSPSHNTSDNIANLDIFSPSSSSHTSSTPSPSNLNPTDEYVPMFPSVQERIHNLIQRYINVGQKLPEGHWDKPGFLNPQPISVALPSDSTEAIPNPQPTHEQNFEITHVSNVEVENPIQTGLTLEHVHDPPFEPNQSAALEIPSTNVPSSSITIIPPLKNVLPPPTILLDSAILKEVCENIFKDLNKLVKTRSNFVHEKDYVSERTSLRGRVDYVMCELQKLSIEAHNQALIDL